MIRLLLLFLLLAPKDVRPTVETVGSLTVFTLDGKMVEHTGDIDRPNNVDILGDICVTTERLASRLGVYRVFAEKPHLRSLA